MTIKQKDWKLKISSQTVANKETKSRKQKKQKREKSLKNYFKSSFPSAGHRQSTLPGVTGSVRTSHTQNLPSAYAEMSLMLRLASLTWDRRHK